MIFKGRDFIYVHTEIMKGDRALVEKPSIASVGLVVTARQSLLDTLAIKDTPKHKNKLKVTDLTRKKSKQVKRQHQKITKGLNHES